MKKYKSFLVVLLIVLALVVVGRYLLLLIPPSSTGFNQYSGTNCNYLEVIPWWDSNIYGEFKSVSSVSVRNYTFTVNMYNYYMTFNGCNINDCGATYNYTDKYGCDVYNGYVTYQREYWEGLCSCHSTGCGGSACYCSCANPSFAVQQGWNAPSRCYALNGCPFDSHGYETVTEWRQCGGAKLSCKDSRNINYNVGPSYAVDVYKYGSYVITIGDTGGKKGSEVGCSFQRSSFGYQADEVSGSWGNQMYFGKVVAMGNWFDCMVNSGYVLNYSLEQLPTEWVDLNTVTVTGLNIQSSDIYNDAGQSYQTVTGRDKDISVDIAKSQGFHLIKSGQCRREGTACTLGSQCCSGNCISGQVTYRPISYTLSSYGINTNPTYAYDDGFNDTTTYAETREDGLVGGSIIYNFNIGSNVSSIIFFTFNGYGPGRIELYNYATSAYVTIATNNINIATRSVQLQPNYISSVGDVKLRLIMPAFQGAYYTRLWDTYIQALTIDKKCSVVQSFPPVPNAKAFFEYLWEQMWLFIKSLFGWA